jgi:hypothetical protein
VRAEWWLRSQLRLLGLRTAVIERSEWFGGTSAMSGGSVWVPNAPQIRAAGLSEDPQRIVDYLSAVAGPSVSEALVHGYVDAAPKMMAFLQSASPYLRDGFAWMRGYPDYFPQLGGSPLGWGCGRGRSIDEPSETTRRGCALGCRGSQGFRGGCG